MKKILSIAAACMVGCMSGAAARPEGGPPPPGQPPSGQSSAKGRQQPQQSRAQNGRKPGRRTSASGARMSQGRRSELSESDQKLIDAIEEADSFAMLMRLSRSAQMSRSSELREAMVDALESQGKNAVNELASYIGDSNEDVSDSAFSAWSSILEEMKPQRRVLAIQAAAQKLQGNRLQGGGQHGKGVPHQGMPQQGMPHQGMHQQGMPQQGMHQQGMPQQGAPQQPMHTGPGRR